MNLILTSVFIASLTVKMQFILIALFLRFIKTISPVVVHVIFGLINLCLLLVINQYIEFDLLIVASFVIFGITTCLFLFSAVYKSLSIRQLLEINNLDKKMTLEALDVSVTKKSFVERIELLCSMGLVIKQGEAYKVSEKGKKLTSRILFLRKLFGINTNGLYQLQNDSIGD